MVDDGTGTVPRVTHYRPLSIPDETRATATTTENDAPAESGRTLTLVTGAPIGGMDREPVIRATVDAPSYIPENKSARVVCLGRPGIVSRPRLGIFGIKVAW